jgi:hypothetical protein
MYPIGDYVIVRTCNAGVFAGTLKTVDGDVVQVENARRLWYWSGAASLSELACKGVSRPSQCKFPAEVPVVTLREWIELLPVSEQAMKSIKEVPTWSES